MNLDETCANVDDLCLNSDVMYQKRQPYGNTFNYIQTIMIIPMILLPAVNSK